MFVPPPTIDYVIYLRTHVANFLRVEAEQCNFHYNGLFITELQDSRIQNSHYMIPKVFSKQCNKGLDVYDPQAIGYSEQFLLNVLVNIVEDLYHLKC